MMCKMAVGVFVRIVTTVFEKKLQKFTIGCSLVNFGYVSQIPVIRCDVNNIAYIGPPHSVKRL